VIVMTQELALRRTSSNGHRLLGRRDEGDQVDIQLRTACKACEIAWGVEHCTSEESSGAVFERPAPRKMVYAEPAHASAYPIHCLHCGDAPRISACPKGAGAERGQFGCWRTWIQKKHFTTLKN
jgi:Fe-S-cluster-containing dehydrogenase component